MSDQQHARAAVELAQRQHGLITREQFVRLGMPRRTVERRIADGMWIPYGPGVLRLVGSAPSRLMLARALLLDTPQATITGAAALELEAGQSIPGFAEDDLWLVAPRVHRPGIRMVHHPDLGFRKAAGLLLPAYPCVVADMMRLLPAKAARDTAHRMLQARKVTQSELLLEAAKLRRREGGAQLLEIAREVASGSHAESEALLHDILKRVGVGGWRANLRVESPDGPRFIDVAFPSAMVAVEVDGRAHHSGDEAFESDRERQNQLQLLGWRVLRFTWKRLTRDPEGVLEEILAAVQLG